jgi:putative phosphoribosyl transferase
VAGVLRNSGLGTLLFDLLTPDEAEDRRNVFDIDLLSHRLLAATTWTKGHPSATNLKIGYFGASTGAAAALRASVYATTRIDAIVSRGGRPDMATDVLGRVRAPTLLIVGGDDELVLELNRNAYKMLSCEKELKIVPGATHLFEEPGKIEEVAKLANDWFVRHLTSSKVN